MPAIVVRLFSGDPAPRSRAIPFSGGGLYSSTRSLAGCQEKRLDIVGESGATRTDEHPAVPKQSVIVRVKDQTLHITSPD
jgi:hypothetical protein